MDEQRKSDIVELYMSGSSYKDIALKIGIGKTAIYGLLKELNLINTRKLIHEYEDLTDKEYGFVKVISHVKTGRYAKGGVYQLWKCECLLCGTINNIRSGNLKNGQKSCKKCSSKIASENKKECLIDYNVWYRMLSRAKSRDIEITLTQQDCLDVFNSQNGKCALSGVPIFFGERRCDESTASPDRIDTNFGYIHGNLRWVHKFVNSMRSNLKANEFIWWCKTITEFNKDVLDLCNPPDNVFFNKS